MSLFHEIEKTAWSGNQNVASFLKLLTLEASRGTAINNTRTQHRAIAQTTRFIKDLGGQFTSGADDQNQRLCSNSILPWVESFRGVRSRSSQLPRLAHQLGKNWNEESPRLSRAYVLLGSTCAKHHTPLHVPVWATAIRSRLARTAGIAYDWTAVGCSYPQRRIFSRITGCKPKFAHYESLDCQVVANFSRRLTSVTALISLGLSMLTL